MHEQSCCFAYKTYCFFDVLVAVRVVGLLKSMIQRKENVLQTTTLAATQAQVITGQTDKRE